MRTIANSRALLAGTMVLLGAACTKSQSPDAFGNFEAEEVVVSAESSGPLRHFEPVEGLSVKAGVTVAQLDTIQAALERDQLLAQRASLLAHRREVDDQLRALQVQHDIAVRARTRIDRLFAAQAATAQQRDQTERDERVLGVQVSSARTGLTRVAADVSALDARVASVQDRMRRATVINPVAGTVLATYVRAGEIIQPGQPLYRVASLDTLTLRAYVSGAQLAAFRLGQSVNVKVDGAAGALRGYTGVVSWVSSRAEFTPTPVQTRDDRSDLVYAVKVRVANSDGALKIGMPADVTVPTGPTADAPSTTPSPATKP